MPIGSSMAISSNGQSTWSAVDHLVQQPARQSRLHEVPVAEQHRVGDGADERRPDERPHERHGRVAAGVEGRGEQSDRADRPPARGRARAGTRRAASSTDGTGRRRGDRAFDPRHRRDPLGPTVELRFLPADTGGLAVHRHGQGERAGQRHTERGRLADRYRAEAHARQERADSEAEVDAAQEPAVAEADDPPAGREPAEQHPARRPLEQHGGGVEADHVRAG